MRRPYVRYKSPAESFAARTDWVDGCLLWVRGYTVKSKNNEYGVISIGGGREELVHRWAWEQENGPIPDGVEIDHRCHNTTCANVKHLRLATSAQNKENHRGAYANNKSSGIRGVSWDKSRNKWIAYTSIDGKLKNLGRYEDKEVAAEVVRKARVKHHTHNDADRITGS